MATAGRVAAPVLALQVTEGTLVRVVPGWGGGTCGLAGPYGLLPAVQAAVTVLAGRQAGQVPAGRT